MANPLLLWLALAENHIINWILRRPSFHRFVETAHRQVHRVRHGKPPEELGGTNIDNPAGSPSSFLKHFRDELRTQARDLTRRNGRSR